MEILLVKTDDENFYVLKIYLKSQINIFINSNEFLRDRSFGHLREALVHQQPSFSVEAVSLE